MSGVQIPSFSTTDETGTTWVASWDENGKISYSGKDKDGNSVNITPPSDIIKKAHDYGASFSNEKKQSSDKNERKSNDKEATTNGSATNKNPVLKDLFKKHPNLSSVGYDPKSGEILFRPSTLNKAINEGISKEDKESLRNYFQQFSKTNSVNDQPRGLINKFKTDVKFLGKGFVSDLKRSNLQTWELLKETGKLPVRIVSDIYKAGKLIGKGKFRELRDRFALRVHDNLETLGILSDNMQQRIDVTNKHIEERLGIKDRSKNPNFLAKFYGKPIRDMRALFNKLRGRDTTSQTIKTSTVGVSPNNKGISR